MNGQLESIIIVLLFRLETNTEKVHTICQKSHWKYVYEGLELYRIEVSMYSVTAVMHDPIQLHLY